MYFIQIILLYFIIINIVKIVFLLIRIAFITLIERKVLRYIQIRTGPNKVGIIGIFQPFRDAIKLFIKERSYLILINYIYFYISPFLIFWFIMLTWIYIDLNIFFNQLYSLIGLICIIGLLRYPLIISGWYSRRIFRLLGRLRRISQIISYEVRFIFIIFLIFYINKRFNLIEFLNYQFNCYYIILLLLLLGGFIISMLAETNRSPFDFSEGESELVSGFNIEYSRWIFSFIFLGEYGIILLIRILISLIFIRRYINIYIIIKIYLIIFFWIWVRGTLPRFRFDLLMSLAWKIFLPFYILIFFIYFIIRIYINIKYLF